MQRNDSVMLASAREKMFKSQDLKFIAQNHIQDVLTKISDLPNPPYLSPFELLALYKSAKESVEDAKLLASYLYQLNDKSIDELQRQADILFHNTPADKDILKDIFKEKNTNYRKALNLILTSNSEQGKIENHIVYLLGLTEVKHNYQGWGVSTPTGLKRLKQISDDPEYTEALRKEFPGNFEQVKSEEKENVRTGWVASNTPTTTPLYQVTEVTHKTNQQKVPKGLDYEKSIIDKIKLIMATEAKLGNQPKLFKTIYDVIHKYNANDKSIYPQLLDELKETLQDKSTSFSKSAIRSIGAIKKDLPIREHKHVVSYVIYEALKGNDNVIILSQLSEYQSKRAIPAIMRHKIPTDLLKEHDKQVKTEHSVEVQKK